MAVPTKLPHKHKPGRDGGKIVAEYMIGGTRVLINDQHMARTPEERDLVDERIANAAWACEMEAYERAEREAGRL